MKKILFSLLTIGMLFTANSCTDDTPSIELKQKEVTKPDLNAPMRGFYVLNEGLKGGGNASIDFFNYSSGYYTQDIYYSINPEIVKGLGDSGHDLQMHNNRVYAVMTGSNKIEVFDSRTAKRIGDIKITGCRNIVFNDAYAYVSSYGNSNNIYKINLETLDIVYKTSAGRDPESMVIHEGKLYVANTGGLTYPQCDKTVSVIDLNTFTEDTKITVGLDPIKITKNSKGELFVATADVSDWSDPTNVVTLSTAALYVIDTNTNELRAQNNKFDINAGNMAMYDDKIYFIDYSDSRYKVFDTKTNEVLATRFLSAEASAAISNPYSVNINPQSGDIIIADAGDYQSSGKIFCFDKLGSLKWSTTAGALPAYVTFLTKAE